MGEDMARHAGVRGEGSGWVDVTDKIQAGGSNQRISNEVPVAGATGGDTGPVFDAPAMPTTSTMMPETTTTTMIQPKNMEPSMIQPPFLTGERQTGAYETSSGGMVSHSVGADGMKVVRDVPPVRPSGPKSFVELEAMKADNAAKIAGALNQDKTTPKTGAEVAANAAGVVKKKGLFGLLGRK